MNGWSVKIAVLLGASVAGWCHADDRLFTYSYQATTLPAGKVEMENWITWKTETPEDSTYNRVEFRHELEIGLTDRVQLDLYLADWSYTDEGHGSTGKFKYDDSAATIKINYLNPSTERVGVASYHEVKIGDEIFELENKLLLQVNFERVTAVYNLTLEAEWEGHAYEEANGELSQTLGASYEITPQLFAGLEALYEIPLPDWHTGADQNFFIGPVASYRFGDAHDWWITGTLLRQTTDTEGEPLWQLRLLFGFTF